MSDVINMDNCDMGNININMDKVGINAVKAEGNNGGAVVLLYV